MVLNTIRIFDRVQKLSCENIMLQSYHLVLQKCENLKVLGKSVGGENAKVPRYEVKW